MIAHVSAAEARARIAAMMLEENMIVESIGRIRLRPRQQLAASRLLRVTRDHGGALLAEPVGLGKTYASIAAAARLGDTICVVAPAALREMWRAALRDCDIDATIVTHEAMSRGSRLPESAVIVVDEAHRFRNPASRRYAMLADCCRRAKVILLSATPIHNTRNDLPAQLALFLGRRAWTMPEDELVSFVVRGNGDTEGLPVVRGPLACIVAGDDDCLGRIIALPPPFPANDEGVAASLLTYGLVHQWTSSRGALLGALRRRRARGLAMLAAFEAGRDPSRSELSAWSQSDGAMQLAFPELVVGQATPVDIDRSEAAGAIERHLAAIAALVEHCRSTADPDAARADALLRIRDNHSGERVIAFCQYTETVVALRRYLARTPALAALTAHGAEIAGGRITRAEVIAQFSPGASPRATERIDLLVTTDLLSEGLNLQEASVVVHLDLPWNPARLEQRVGRVRRIGSRHREITVYFLAPPASAEELLRIEARLQEKIRIASRAIGVAGRILPTPSLLHSSGLAQSRSMIDDSLHRWAASGFRKRDDSLYIAAVRATVDGFLALIESESGPKLVAGIDTRISAEPAAILDAIAAAEGEQTDARSEHERIVLDRLDRYLNETRAIVAIDFNAAASGRARRFALSRVAQTLARAPRHRRAQLAPLADAARHVALAPLGEGAERVLEMLARSDLPDEAWLRSIAAFGELNSRSGPAIHSDRKSGIRAVILFQRDAL